MAKPGTIEIKQCLDESLLSRLDSGQFLFVPAIMRQTIGEMNDSFKAHYHNFRLCYSVKANQHPDIIKVALEEGSGLEFSSRYELESLDKDLLGGALLTANTPGSLVGLFNKVRPNLSSASQLRYLAQEATAVDFGLRLSLDGESRFGLEFPSAELEFVISELLKNRLAPTGLHCHRWTAERSAAAFAEATQSMLRAYDALSEQFSLSWLNLGGGQMGRMPQELQRQFGTEPVAWAAYAEAVAKPVAEHFEGQSTSPELLIEPGAALVADSVFFLAEVIDIKATNAGNWAVLNASNSWLRPTGHTKALAYQHLKSGSGRSYAGCKLVGATCMETDIIGHHESDLQIGDRFLFSNMGAYTYAFSSGFIVGPPKLSTIDV